jgi:hypothetical protein
MRSTGGQTLNLKAKSRKAGRAGGLPGQDRTQLAAARRRGARLEVRKNDLIQDRAEKTRSRSRRRPLADQLKVTYDLKREAARAN